MKKQDTILKEKQKNIIKLLTVGIITVIITL